MIRDFQRRFGGSFSAGISEKWYVKEDSPPIEEFDESSEPYQAFLNIFDGALQFFSCFVRGKTAGIDFNSTRTNYNDIRPGEGLIHDHATLWTGPAGIFLNSAIQLRNVLLEIGSSYSAGLSGYNGNPVELRIISPRGGALVSRLVGENSLTIQVDESTLDRVVADHEKRKSSFRIFA